jgi:putative sterol carrier protein
MPYFTDGKEVYRYLGRLLEDLVADHELAPKFQRANTVVQYRYREPDAQTTVKMLEGDELQVVHGDTDLQPEVVLEMASDTAHEFWLGGVNVTVALARGRIKAKGPVNKVLKLVPLVKPAFPRYEKMLEADGRDDLLAARKP